ncbi:uncharacterized protein LOC131235218 isoform X2 [Magnolia sinica]|uniref:uncharacterized protein LOC131235218 isoform X2 n=1 Tax=Magnolia sinica TaxID=86752 RepID=UPI00265952E7|nr:uncharacterized protein LOC131235218 isoform X2 [Magnolia sinica]
MQGKRRRIRSRERALSVSPVDLFVSLSSSTSLSFSDRHQLVSLHVAQCRYQLHDASMFQQNLFNVGYQNSNIAGVSCSGFQLSINFYQQNPSSTPHDSSTRSVLLSQPSLPSYDNNQLLGCEDCHPRSSN